MGQILGQPLSGYRGPRKRATVIDVRATDRELMDSMGAGDEAVLGTLYNRHSRRVFGVALRILGDPTRAEEVTQDVFLALWDHRSRFESSRGSLVAWLATMARNRAIDRSRGRSRLEHGHDEVPAAAAAATDVFAEVAGRLERARLAEAIAHLADEQRTVIELAYLAGYSQREIARVLAVPTTTIKGRLRLGLRKLGRELAVAETGSGLGG